MLRPSLLVSLLSVGTMLHGSGLFHRAPSQPKEQCPEGPKHMRVGVRHIEGKGIGYSDGYTTLEGFFATDPYQWVVMPILDLRGHVFDNGKLAANAGLGLRSLWGCRAYGINTYYDYRNDKKGFNQVGVGLETLGEIWDVRVNGYFPVGDKTSSPYKTRFSRFSGNNAIISQKYECTMQGFDAEVGGHMNASDFYFYAGAGPYYVNGHIGPSAWGGKARVSGMWREYVGLEVSASYDTIFHGIVQGQISFNFPFGPRAKAKTTQCQTTCSNADKLSRRMMQPVARDEIIVLNKTRKQSVAMNPSTGDPWTFWFVDNTSHSAGTFNSPFSTLADASTAAGQGDVIYVFPGDMTDTGMSSGITLQNSQQLLGATVSQELETTVGVVTIPAQSSSIFLPTLTSGTGNVVTLANDNVVSGLSIQNLNGHGIYGNAISNATVTQNLIQGVPHSGQNGIELDAATGINTFASNMLNNENNGIYINNSSSPVSDASYLVTGNNMGYASEYVIQVDFTGDGFGNTVAITNNQINTYDYIYVTCANTSAGAPHVVTLENNNIVVGEDDGGFNVAMAGYSSIIATVNNNNLTSIGSNGYFVDWDLVDHSSGTLTMNNNTCTAQYYTVYLVASSSANLSCDITNNTFITTGDDVAIDVGISDSATCPLVNISNNTFIGGSYTVDVDYGSPGTSVLSILNNSFTLQNADAVSVTNNATSSDLKAVISGNSFEGFVAPAVSITNGSGTTCLQMNNNTAYQYPGAYQLVQSGGTFNLVTPSGNEGQVTESGTINTVISCE